MFRSLFVPMIVAVGGMIVPGPYCYAEGLGATCWARPYSANRFDHVTNMCQTVGETQYPGINMIAAKALTIQECINRNALDYGCDYERKGCCAPQCEQVAVCLYFTPNKESPEKAE